MNVNDDNLAESLDLAELSVHNDVHGIIFRIHVNCNVHACQAVCNLNILAYDVARLHRL